MIRPSELRVAVDVNLAAVSVTYNSRGAASRDTGFAAFSSTDSQSAFNRLARLYGEHGQGIADVDMPLDTEHYFEVHYETLCAV